MAITQMRFRLLAGRDRFVRRRYRRYFANSMTTTAASSPKRKSRLSERGRVAHEPAVEYRRSNQAEPDTEVLSALESFALPIAATMGRRDRRSDAGSVIGL